jgi:hypothetical protein
VFALSAFGVLCIDLKTNDKMAKRKNGGGQKKKKNGGKGKVVKPVVLANNVSPRPLAMPRVQPRPKTNSQHVRGVCSVTDPFCPAAKNSKWPDGTSGNTMTQQFRGNVNIGTDAAGYAAFGFAAAAPFGYLKTATIVGTTPPVATWPAAYTTYQASSILATYGQDVRIVSAGVVIRSVASATTSSGLATFGTVGSFPAPSSTMNLGTELYDAVAIKAIQPGMEFSWVSMARGSSARTFAAQSTSTVITHDWTSLIIEVSGGPISTNVLNCEWFINVEFNLGVGAAIAPLATANPPRIGSAESAVSMVHQSLGGLIEGGVATVEKMVTDHATKAIASLMNDPFAALASLF